VRSRRFRRSSTLPPPRVIPEWRGLARGASQAGPGHARFSRGWVEIIPDWRRLQRTGVDWRRVEGVRFRAMSVAAIQCPSPCLPIRISKELLQVIPEPSQIGVGSRDLHLASFAVFLASSQQLAASSFCCQRSWPQDTLQPGAEYYNLPFLRPVSQ
jgi:hypothetical protein